MDSEQHIIEGPYGNCKCGTPLVAHWFLERQTERDGYPTGLVRKNIDVLACPSCLREYCLDDTFASKWHRCTAEEMEVLA